MGSDWAITGIGQVCLVALAFGVMYALFVRWMTRKGLEGYTAFIVAGGVFGTLAIASLSIGVEAAALALLIFGFTGAPMIAEYVLRVHEERQYARERALQDARAAQELAKGLLNGD
jgi:hypothetical protein